MTRGLEWKAVAQRAHCAHTNRHRLRNRKRFKLTEIDTERKR